MSPSVSNAARLLRDHRSQLRQLGQSFCCLLHAHMPRTHARDIFEYLIEYDQRMHEPFREFDDGG